MSEDVFEDCFRSEDELRVDIVRNREIANQLLDKIQAEASNYKILGCLIEVKQLHDRLYNEHVKMHDTYASLLIDDEYCASMVEIFSRYLLMDDEEMDT